ncbi:MAG TPA: GMC family oxidoreductase [Steroidobacteraceae bacterium]|nr:GMC family oxidoreductase [Steroidobacteraceae bacterium]
MSDHFDVVIVGTSFAASFFLLRYLEHASPTARILVLERGNEDTKAWQLTNRRHSSIEPEEVFENDNPLKEWYTSPGFGGNSKCWMGGTTRMMPGDFQLRSRYGVGTDWPVSYEDLETHYCTAEQVMLVSGPGDSPMRRSKPFPLPPHRFSDPDALLKKHFPEGWYQMATARASVATGKRGICCSTGFCSLCPVDAKFTIGNGLAHLYQDPRVVLRLRSEVQTIDTAAGVAQGVNYLDEGKLVRATGDLIILGASALFNPHILLRSGFDHPLIGRRLHEQMPVYVTLDLKGVKCYNGSTVLSGLGYLFYEGEHRRDHAACMIETWNSPFANRPDDTLRLQPGRWNERMMLGFLFDDIPSDANTVTVSTSNPRMAKAHFTNYSDYAMRGAEQIPKMIDKLAEALPIERLVGTTLGTTAAHIQGTVVMGNDPATSVVDRHLIHHTYRNLLVLGSSAYPTASPAYPSLTVSALSLWAADHVLGLDA